MEGALVVIERIRSVIEKIHLVADDGTEFHITASLGVSLLDPKSALLLDAIQDAVHALHGAKVAGRNRIRIYA